MVFRKRTNEYASVTGEAIMSLANAAQSLQEAAGAQVVSLLDYLVNLIS